jgi:hypothetical protein
LLSPPVTPYLPKSTSFRNLYYQEYLKGHTAITLAAFEMHWKGLPRDTQKRWVNLKVSKSKKAASANVVNGEETMGN